MSRLNVAIAGWLAVCLAVGAAAEEVGPRTALGPQDVYLLEGPQSVVVAPDGKQAALIRRWIDADSRAERLSLWIVPGDPQQARHLEAGQPDARARSLAPTGAGSPCAVRDRGRMAGARLHPRRRIRSGNRHLAGCRRRLAAASAGRQGQAVWPRASSIRSMAAWPFRPDGKRLAFVADDGRDPRTPAELTADVSLVRHDQGEGYTGFGPAQIWIADLDLQQAGHAATNIRRLTDDRGLVRRSAVDRRTAQWLICHANKSSDVESVRYSINKNYDLWAIDVDTGHQRRLTFGRGRRFRPAFRRTASGWSA